mmetsp:Transcript_44127/g.120267  ORF Transcript_44127/g.120267 Transcript_44127/m.120267 type:complete len:302 (-) Transcript_44127:120-1025(-)
MAPPLRPHVLHWALPWQHGQVHHQGGLHAGLPRRALVRLRDEHAPRLRSGGQAVQPAPGALGVRGGVRRRGDDLRHTERREHGRQRRHDRAAPLPHRRRAAAREPRERRRLGRAPGVGVRAPGQARRRGGLHDERAGQLILRGPQRPQGLPLCERVGGESHDDAGASGRVRGALGVRPAARQLLRQLECEEAVHVAQRQQHGGDQLAGAHALPHHVGHPLGAPQHRGRAAGVHLARHRVRLRWIAQLPGLAQGRAEEEGRLGRSCAWPAWLRLGRRWRSEIKIASVLAERAGAAGIRAGIN